MAHANDQLRSFVERVQRIEEEIKERNNDKRDIYAEAKGVGFDVKALKAVIAYLRKDANDRAEHDAIVETYLHSLGIGTEAANKERAPVHVREAAK